MYLLMSRSAPLSKVAEKNSVWRTGAVLRRIASTAGWKAHVEHAVGLVENDDAARIRARPDGGPDNRSEPAGRRNQNLRAFPDGL